MPVWHLAILPAWALGNVIDRTTKYLRRKARR